MRRALAILKYVPAVLCGLLVVAWAVSVTIPIGYRRSIGNDGYYVMINLHSGNLDVWIDPHPFGTGFEAGFQEPETKGPGHPWSGWFGDLSVHSAGVETRIDIPILLILSALLPLTFYPFFRFPLWSYFAWTALVAAELAYYLR